VLSAGGIEAAEFLVTGVQAFLASTVEPMGLDVFLSPDATNRERAALKNVATHERIEVHEFSAVFNAHLETAVVSISRAGYNTAAALMRCRVPAVVVPDPRLSDQEERARILGQHGLAVTVPSSDQFDPVALTRAIDAAAAMPPRPHTFDLDGAGATRRILETASV
jgi:predicted glycosyltransferase